MGLFDEKPVHKATFGERLLGESTAVRKPSLSDNLFGGVKTVREATWGERISGASEAYHSSSESEDFLGESDAWQWK